MIPPSTTITDEGRRTRRTLLWLAGGIVALNVVVWAASSLTSGGAVAGPEGSSFVTTAQGSAAAAGMFERLGLTVERSRLPLDEVELSPGGTLMLVDIAGAEYTPAEVNAVIEFMERGGFLVLAGQTELVERLFTDPSSWRSAGGDAAAPVTPPLDPALFDDARLSGFGSLEVSDGDIPIWATAEGTVVAVTRPVGDGWFSWVADSAPFHNGQIGAGDTAVAVFHLLQPDGPVVFDEYRHGFRQDAGLWAVIPPNWRRMLWLAGATGVLALVAYARRLGPPHDVRRRLPPTRAAYLDAVAGLMSRAGATEEALRTLRAEGRDRLAARAFGGAELAAVAAGAGLDEEATRAVLGDDVGEGTLMAADRALAILTQEKR
ncbi:MAG TPA: DUF4350 domain-containing protein [Acidimicrobiia bacterium]|nr:DUF4350 domain-containing protein [Acidimicrobiia bacterium]